MYQHTAKPTGSPRRSSSRWANASACLLSALLAAVLTLGVVTKDARSQPTAPFEVAEIFFELNDTDGDLGIHALIDGGPWVELTIDDGSKNSVILGVQGQGNVGDPPNPLGLTEIFFESAEPPFDELKPGDFFALFPKGIYAVSGTTTDGDDLRSTTKVTHLMPAPASGISVSGTPIDPGAVDCDEGPIPKVPDDAVIISWDEVTMSHPDPDGGGAGVQPPKAVTIINYQVVVEVELSVQGKDFASVFSVILPPDETSMTVPPEVIALGDEFKFEILAREKSFNQTAVESCFEIDEE